MRYLTNEEKNDADSFLMEQFMEKQKKSITKQQYYTLIGLKETAKKQWLVLEELEKVAKEITGEQNKPFGHVTDYLGGNRELDDMLEILEIEVEK